MTDENEYSDLPFKSIVTEILDDRNRDYKISGNQLNGCCPFHDDTKPSFGINLKTGLYNCFTCEEHGDIASFVSKLKYITRDEALQLLGYPYIETDYRYTLKDYAEEKNLNINTLKEWKLSSNEVGVEIPYFDENSHYIATRFRHNPNHTPRFTWEKGSKTTLYGLWYLNSIPSEYIILVEGESDCHCAWSKDIFALGVPRCKKLRKRLCKTTK